VGQGSKSNPHPDNGPHLYSDFSFAQDLVTGKQCNTKFGTTNIFYLFILLLSIPNTTSQNTLCETHPVK